MQILPQMVDGVDVLADGLAQLPGINHIPNHRFSVEQHRIQQSLMQSLFLQRKPWPVGDVVELWPASQFGLLDDLDVRFDWPVTWVVNQLNVGFRPFWY